MTTALDNRRDQYTASASQTKFDVTFPIFVVSGLKVFQKVLATGVITELATPADYTVTLDGTAPNTADVDLVVGAAAGDTITIDGDTEVARASDFTTGGDYFAETVNDAEDRQYFIMQERKRDADAAVVSNPVSPSTFDPVLPDVVGNGDTFLRLASDGLSWAFSTLADLGSVVISDLLPQKISGAGSGGASVEVARADHSHPGDTIDFTLGLADPAHLEGRWFWDDTNQCPAWYNSEAEVSHQSGREQWVRSRNSTGSTLLDAKAVYISGSTGQFPNISLAKADVVTTARMVGLTTHDIENNTFGETTTFGFVNDVDTSAFSAGDTLFLSAATAGEITATAPTGTNLDIIVGTVLTSSPTQGKIFVHVGQDLIQRASQAEAEAGTDDTKMMTPLRAAQAITNNSGTAKAWGNLNGSGTIGLNGSFNIASVVDNGTGDYTENFTNVFDNNDYSFQATAGFVDDASDSADINGRLSADYTASSMRFVTFKRSTSAAFDVTEATTAFFGDLA